MGTDASGRTYWVLEDPPSVLDGTAWVCRCAKQDGSDWETVTDDLETLESLLTWLSLSSETLELQLWQTFSGGILKSLTRRYKKKQQSEQRMARMPRLLGTTGLDLASMVSVDDDGFGVRRSMRSRRAVNYRIEESEDEGENASDDSDEEERDEDEEINGDGGDDDDEEMRPSKRQRRSLQLSKRVEGEPSRRSSRLRGGGVDRNKHDDDVVCLDAFSSLRCLSVSCVLTHRRPFVCMLSVHPSIHQTTSQRNPHLLVVIVALLPLPPPVSHRRPNVVVVELCPRPPAPSRKSIATQRKKRKKRKTMTLKKQRRNKKHASLR